MNLTIRLKLTLWYSLMLIVTSGLFIVLANTVVTQQYHKTPQEIFSEIQERDPQFQFGGRPNGDDPFMNRQDVATLVRQVREEDQQKIQNTVLGIFIVIMALSFGGGYIIAGRMLSPIRKINEETRKMSADNLQPIEGSTVQDELGELTINLNGMITRLRDSFHVQKQFVENASHELKTPLTIVQTNLEAALEDKTVARDEMQEYINQALKSTQFMNRLTEDLLLLSVVKEHIPFDDVQTKDVVEGAVKQLQPIALEQKKNIITQFPDHIKTIKGNSTLLTRAVMNCIENAIKYDRTKIIVQVALTNNRIQITVQDDGEGILQEHIAKVFDRFYRADDARSRRSGGAGLGLAITKSIIEKHNGSITLSSEPEKG